MIQKLKSILLLIRVRDWVKNLFVFVPLFFAGKIDLLFSFNMLILFFSFCITASSVYILNDIIDIEKDKLHPKKCKRPIADGSIRKKEAFLILFFLLVLLVVLLSQLKIAYMHIMAYFILNILYSFKLKSISIIDVSTIALGFVIRILAGGMETNIYISHWLVIIVFLITISLAFAKRRDDLNLNLDTDNFNLRNSLKGYNIRFLDTATIISFSITLIAYIMYSISSEVMERIGSDKVYITSFFVFLGIMRYLQITIVENDSGSPTDIIWKDKFIKINLLAWLLTFTIFIYGNDL